MQNISSSGGARAAVRPTHLSSEEPYSGGGSVPGQASGGGERGGWSLSLYLRRFSDALENKKTHSWQRYEGDTGRASNLRRFTAESRHGKKGRQMVPW